MKSCEFVRERLEDYLDGELSGEEKLGVAEHVGSCLECRREMMAGRELRERARELRREVPPERDLWPGIEGRISQGRRGSLGPRWFPALAAAAALAVAVGALFVLRTDDAGPGTEEAATISPVPAPDMSARADQARLESGVFQVRRDLLGEIDRRRDEIEPKTLLAIEASMHDLDQAIGEIQSALDEDPENRQLSRLLASRYRQEMQLLRKISRA